MGVVVAIRVMYHVRTTVITHALVNVMDATDHVIIHALQHVKLYVFSTVAL